MNVWVVLIPERGNALYAFEREEDAVRFGQAAQRTAPNTEWEELYAADQDMADQLLAGESDIWHDPDGIWRRIGDATYGPFTSEEAAENYTPGDCSVCGEVEQAGVHDPPFGGMGVGATHPFEAVGGPDA
jgi:hypothetical protein